MSRREYCKECGVPKLISKELTWWDNGTIAETKNPDHRMLFSESENLDGLFSEIEKSIGMPIEKIVVESKRRVTREFIESLIPPFALKLLYSLAPGLIVNRISGIAIAHGYGYVQSTVLKKHTDKGVYEATVIEHPYSIPLYRGDHLGGLEAGTGRDCTSKVTALGGDKYMFEMWAGDHPAELRERMEPHKYPVKDGNIKLERCSKCNTPLAVAEYNFDLDSGMITHPETGTRMAVFGPVGLEAIFTALEEELGDTIPETIITAQARFAKEHFRVRDWVAGEERLRLMTAMRGYGILKNYEADLEHFAITIQNPVVVPLVVGMAKGVFERAMKIDTSVHEWSISEDGELSINIRKES